MNKKLKIPLSQKSLIYKTVNLKVTLILFLSFLSFSCENNNEELSNPYFMCSKIDGEDWKVTKPGDVYFSTSYDYSKNRFKLSLAGADQDLNSICRLTSISFDFVPNVGRYYFNNVGDTSVESGTSAIYIYYDINHFVSKWSTGGYVDIESITKKNIRGTFNFTAKGDANNPSTTNISSGSFNAVYSGGSDKEWLGPSI
jgi:hypothetical protein